MDLAVNPRASDPGRPCGLAGRIVRHAVRVRDAITRIAPLFDFGVRAYVASVFFKSGLTKIASWSTTLSLFDGVYAVPLLPPALAAYLGTAAELALPVLLFAGISTRAAAFALFAFNIVAAISYPDLSAEGLKDHQFWGVLLLVTFFHGPGRLSLDHFFHRRYAS